MPPIDLPNVWVPGTWALVLAGGEGRRLHALTTRNGVVVPKQFCSLRGGPSLLAHALERAGAVAPVIQTCAVVAAQHRWWWSPGPLPPENFLVQPENRGTAHGVLLGLLRLEARDPDAVVLMLPADHYVRREDLLRRSLRQLAELAGGARQAVFLLGAEPDRADGELGYILPMQHIREQPSRVQSFVEKPDLQSARQLLQDGALWNMFIVAGTVRALLALYRDADRSSAVTALRIALGARAGSAEAAAAVCAVYRELDTLDFSRHILAPQARRLMVLAAPPCGWNDIGTPQRVAETLTLTPSRADRADLYPVPAALRLDEQLGRSPPNF